MPERTHTFTITLKIDTDRPEETPQISYKPDGEGLLPGDCIIMCAEAIKWLVSQQAQMAEQVRQEANARIVVPKVDAVRLYGKAQKPRIIQ